MSKRKQKTTVYISMEGHREKCFYDFLYDIFRPRDNHVNITSCPNFGGNSDRILSQALRMKSNYDRVYAWFDEDVQLTSDLRNCLGNAWGVNIEQNVLDKDLQRTYNLKNRNPILIVSNPCSVDGFLVQICGKELPIPLTTKNCKSAFSGIVNEQGIQSEKEFYQKKFTEQSLKQIDNEILKLLLSIFVS